MISLENHYLNEVSSHFDLRKLTFVFAIDIFFTAKCDAQEKTPRKEFLVKLSKYKILLAPGEKDSIEVKIIRSEFFKNLPVQLSVAGKIPRGITTDIKHPKGNEPGKIIFTANDDVLSDDCHLIVQGKTLTSRIISRGSVLKLSSRTEQTTKY